MRRETSILIQLSLVAPSLWTPGCSVDNRMISSPAPIVIDTFEDGTAHPLDPRFSPWEYGPVDTYGDVSAPMVQPGYQSNWALALDYQLTDPLDGVLSYPFVVEFTQASGGIDLSQYDQVSFAFYYQHTGDCLAAQTFGLKLECGSLGESFIVQVPVSPTWTAVELRLDDFGSGAADGSWEDCIKVIDALTFAIVPPVGDGQCASGNLVFDDVIIR